MRSIIGGGMKHLITILLMALVAPVMAESELSDEEAKRAAQRMATSIEAMQGELPGANRDSYQLQIRPKLEALIKNWPEMNGRNRAIFPYQACQQAARDLMGYADTFFLLSDSADNRQRRERKKTQFNTAHPECTASIKNPDMSLKEILTEFDSRSNPE
ncbi:hypothetical protein [Nitrosospira briensis]|uniref:hypothetical protein n=1 Tax=Nitrosospira briensis TaxID=35799 RepID=UPI0018CFFD02|nr:hypothetical protein [Nitrosospira briensis]